MSLVIIASTNPVKIEAARLGFVEMFPGQEFYFEGVKANSNVKDQPMDNFETLIGAKNRVENASKNYSADYYVGMEGGIEKFDGGMKVYAWIVIKSKERMGRAKTGSYFLPPKIAELISQGKELGEADDIVFQRSNSKQDNGSVGILTNNVFNRTIYYRDAVILALIPFKNPDIY